MSAHDAKGAGSTRLVGIVFPKDGQADAPGTFRGLSWRWFLGHAFSAPNALGDALAVALGEWQS